MQRPEAPFKFLSALLLKHVLPTAFIIIGEEGGCFGLRAADSDMITVHDIFWLSNSICWNDPDRQRVGLRAMLRPGWFYRYRNGTRAGQTTWNQRLSWPHCHIQHSGSSCTRRADRLTEPETSRVGLCVYNIDAKRSHPNKIDGVFPDLDILNLKMPTTLSSPSCCCCQRSPWPRSKIFWQLVSVCCWCLTSHPRGFLSSN